MWELESLECIRSERKNSKNKNSISRKRAKKRKSMQKGSNEKAQHKTVREVMGLTFRTCDRKIPWGGSYRLLYFFFSRISSHSLSLFLVFRVQRLAIYIHVITKHTQLTPRVCSQPKRKIHSWEYELGGLEDLTLFEEEMRTVWEREREWERAEKKPRKIYSSRNIQVRLQLRHWLVEDLRKTWLFLGEFLATFSKDVGERRNTHGASFLHESHSHSRARRRITGD